jgi:hypothetical protein
VVCARGATAPKSLSGAPILTSEFMLGIQAGRTDWAWARRQASPPCHAKCRSADLLHREGFRDGHTELGRHDQVRRRSPIRTLNRSSVAGLPGGSSFQTFPRRRFPGAFNHRLSARGPDRHRRRPGVDWYCSLLNTQAALSHDGDDVKFRVRYPARAGRGTWLRQCPGRLADSFDEFRIGLV